MKKTALLIIIALVVSMFAFAGGTDETSDSSGSYKKQLVIGINAEPNTAQTPSMSTSAMGQMLNRSSHSTLVDNDLETGEMVPDLATSWDVSADGKVYTFHIRQGVKFSNGEPLTAQDVVFSISERLPKGAIAALAKGIEKVEAKDDYTVVLTLKGAQQDILYTLSSPCAAIVCKKAVEAEGNIGEQYGTGPFYIKEYVQGEYLLMARNNEYYGELPKTEEIKWSIYLEDSARELALETGEIDICYSPANTDIPYIKENSDLSLVSVDGLNVYYVGFNTQAAPFNDVKVRQAIASCINKADAIKVAFDNYATVAENVMAPAVPLYSYVEGYSYDVARAKQLLSESSYPDGFKAKLWIDRADEEQMALVFKENLAQIGIQLEVIRLEATTLKASWKNDDYQMCLQKFGNTGGPDMSFSYVFATTASANRSRVNDEYVDSQIAAAAVEPDVAKRQAMYAELNKYITDAAYWAPVCIPQVFVGAKKELQGAVYAGNTAHDFTYAYIEE